jgi:hypothetical protein
MGLAGGNRVAPVLRPVDVARRIHDLRGQRVILDADLAALYAVAHGQERGAGDRDRNPAAANAGGGTSVGSVVRILWLAAEPEIVRARAALLKHG